MFELENGMKNKRKVGVVEEFWKSWEIMELR